MPRRSTAAWVGGFAAAALALSACSSGGSADPAPAGSEGGEGASGGTIVHANTKPENPLIPADTNEVGGGVVVDALFTGLVDYNPDTAAPENAVASSIESEDNVTWTVKLNDGWTFHDGTPVDADSFVDAWNYNSYGPNALKNSYFFQFIEGFAEAQGEDKNGDEKISADEATVKELSGLKVVSPTEFTVKLSSPQSTFPLQLGYTAFSPLPDSFFDDPKAFGLKPVGNGPFKFDSGNGDEGFKLSKFAEFKGTQPKIDGIEFKTYQSPEAQYTDVLSNNVDFVDQVPANALAGDQYVTDLPDRNINVPVGVIQTATMPIYLDEYKSPDLAKAISLAIDRETIVKQIYNGGRTPATGWTSPVVQGYQEGACGEFCTYDPAKAKEYFAKANFTGKLTYGYNADGPGNKEGAEAICNSIKQAIGADCVAKSYVDFATFRTEVGERKMTGPFRTGWVMDYPGLDNFLVPLYGTGGSSNDNDYSNKEFDALLKEAAELSGDEANAKYFEAEKLLANDMATIPLWYSNQQSGWSDKIENVKIDPFGYLDLESVTVKQ